MIVIHTKKGSLCGQKFTIKNSVTFFPELQGACTFSNIKLYISLSDTIESSSDNGLFIKNVLFSHLDGAHGHKHRQNTINAHDTNKIMECNITDNLRRNQIIQNIIMCDVTRTGNVLLLFFTITDMAINSFNFHKP